MITLHCDDCGRLGGTSDRRGEENAVDLAYLVRLPRGWRVYPDMREVIVTDNEGAWLTDLRPQGTAVRCPRCTREHEERERSEDERIRELLRVRLARGEWTRKST